MEKAWLTGRTVMIVQSDIEGAAPLQDRIVQAGGRVLTAYSLSRALFIAKSDALDDALIEFDFAGGAEVVTVLRERRVPYIFHISGRLSGLTLAAVELPSTNYLGAL